MAVGAAPEGRAAAAQPGGRDQRHAGDEGQQDRREDVEKEGEDRQGDQPEEYLSAQRRAIYVGRHVWPSCFAGAHKTDDADNAPCLVRLCHMPHPGSEIGRCGSDGQDRRSQAEPENGNRQFRETRLICKGCCHQYYLDGRRHLGDEDRADLHRLRHQVGDQHRTDDQNVTRDNEHNQPAGNFAEIAERDEATDQQQLVGNRIEIGAELTHLAELPRQIAVERIGNAGDQEDDKRPFRLAMEHCENEHRNENKATHGNEIRPGHRRKHCLRYRNSPSSIADSRVRPC